MRIASASTAILLIALGSCGENVRKPDAIPTITTVTGGLEVPDTLAGATIGQPKDELAKRGLIASNNTNNPAAGRMDLDKMWSPEADDTASYPRQKGESRYYWSQSDQIHPTWAIYTSSRFSNMAIDEKYIIRRYGKPRLIGRKGRSTYLLYTDEPIGEWEKKYAMTRVCMRPPECADEYGTHCSDPDNVFRKRTMMVNILSGRQMTVFLTDPSLLPVYPIIKPLPKNACVKPEPFNIR